MNIREGISRLLHRYPYLVLPLFCAVLLIASGPLWTYLEFKGYDLRVRLCRHLPFATSQASGKVVFVGIDELAALKKKPFVFWYPDIGRFLRLMAEAHATAVGIDMIPYHPLEQKLADSFKDIQGTPADEAMLTSLGRELDGSLVSGLMEASRTTRITQGMSGSLAPFYYDLMAFMENVEPASLRVDTDADGVLRKQALQPEGGIESFVGSLYRSTGAAEALPQHLKINFALLDSIPVYKFDDVVSGKFDLNKLRDKIVILGMLSTHEDVHTTPLGVRPGALVHGASVESLLTKSFLSTSGYSIVVALVLVMCAAAYPLTRFRSPFRSFWWLSLLTVVYTAVNFGLFARGVDLPLFQPLLAPLLLFCLSYLYRYMIEERSRRQLYQTFSYYVDAAIIDQLITQDPQKLMKGEQRDVCVMFLDIRGFTALSERIPADAIVAMLNTFFGRVTEIVQEHQGFVNKFIGDGMLAFFAVGDEYVDHSLLASAEICRATEQFNESGELRPYLGDLPIAVGIGLHAGTVILGNIGSRRKLDFTVIGPTVNAASRIESLTKQFARTVLVSSTVREMAGSRFSFESLGNASIKGIEGGMEIHAPLFGSTAC